MSVRRGMTKNKSQDLQKEQQSASKDQLISLSGMKDDMQPEKKLTMMRNAKSQLELNNLNENSLIDEDKQIEKS